MRLFYITIALMVSMVFAQNHKVFNTVGLCTLVKDTEYCAIRTSQAIGTFNVGGIYDIAIRNPNGNVSFYMQDKSNVRNEINGYNTTVETSVIVDKDSNKQYIAVNTREHFVMVEPQTQCYNKHYFTGTMEEFKKQYKFVEVTVDELTNYVDTCLTEVIKGEN